MKAATEYGASAPPPGPDAVEASGAPVPGAAEPGEESEESRRLEDAVAVGLQAAREDRLLREEREGGAS